MSDERRTADADPIEAAWIARPAQMTMGECFALVRQVSHLAVDPARSVHRDELVLRLMDVPVCATCGWTQAAHHAAHAVHTCGEFSTAW